MDSIAVDVAWPIAFLAGFVAFFTPCFLPLIPAYVGYLTKVSVKSGAKRWYTLLNAILFVIGFSVVFIALGASVGAVGSLITDYMPIVRKVVGVLLGLFGVMLLIGPYLVRFVPFLSWFYRDVKIVPVSFANRGGYFFSFILGVSFSLAWSPCIGPTLGAVLSLAYDSATVKEGTVLLSIFSLGLAVPFLASALAINFVGKLFRKLARFGRVIEVINGAALVVLGWLIFTDNLVKLNSWFESFNFVYQWA